MSTVVYFFILLLSSNFLNMIVKVQAYSRQRGRLQLDFNHCGSFLFNNYLLDVVLD